jgi:hypothetical protein
MIPSDPIGLFLHLGSLLTRAQIPHALIGGHAVNAWVEPRYTADIDITIQTDAAAANARLVSALGEGGFVRTLVHGEDLPSGPDFIRYKSQDGRVTLELQAAKTAFQRELIERARPLRSGLLRVATPEDLIVLKLIADRPKDQIDLLGLAALPDLDWAYVDRWAKVWGVHERATRLRP